MSRLWEQPDRLETIYRARLFTRDELERLKLLPSEYVYYYYHPERAVDHLSQAGLTRGEALRESNRRLFEELRTARCPSEVYRDYLAHREESYFRLESGEAKPARLPSTPLTGYDRIALAVAEAIWLDEGVHLPVNVANGDTIPSLEPNDVVEVVCRLGSDGASPKAIDAPPHEVVPLISRVKAYERETIRAAMTRRPEAIRTALKANPLVTDDAVELLSGSLCLSA